MSVSKPGAIILSTPASRRGRPILCFVLSLSGNAKRKLFYRPKNIDTIQMVGPRLEASIIGTAAGDFIGRILLTPSVDVDDRGFMMCKKHFRFFCACKMY